MNWKNVKLIFLREVRDQLRDRRTLFMIGVLPLLLYPLLAMTFFQVAQVIHEHPSKVLILTESELPLDPPLIDEKAERFNATLFAKPTDRELLQLTIRKDKPWEKTKETPTVYGTRFLYEADYDVVVIFSAEFADKIKEYRAALKKRAEGPSIRQLSTFLFFHYPPAGYSLFSPGYFVAVSSSAMPQIPNPYLDRNSAREKSEIASNRVLGVASRWIDELVQESLRDQKIPPTISKPFQFESRDLAKAGHRDAAAWSKILPFVLMIWALTGAFYPAIDLCAGEKERGTLETLLSSPARRSEIVCGKLLTIMSFSMATSLLNLICMGGTGMFVINQMQTLSDGSMFRHSFGPPPALAPVWLFIALVPISALFSALCLALASFARSTKEGQYYLMPLMMVVLPLMILPMTSGGELELGHSLIPVAGVVLLLKAMLEGNIEQAVPYILPVTLMTLLCCIMAIRWAVDQFNKENVLFREGERFELSLWFRRLVKDRDIYPSAGEGLFCAAIILVIEFFLSLSMAHMGKPDSLRDLMAMVVVPQLTAILTPALIMTVMLSRRPGQTLRLRWPKWWTIPLTIALALCMEPAVHELQMYIRHLYPIRKDHVAQLEDLVALTRRYDAWIIILIIAALPAICEELAFRGFVLSGLQGGGKNLRAVVVASAFFALAHPIIQQSINAFVLGILLGYIAIRTGSILPGVLFHVTHNGFTVLLDRNKFEVAAWLKETPLPWLMTGSKPEEMEFAMPFTIGATLIAAALGYVILRFGRRTDTLEVYPESPFARPATLPV